MARRSNRPRPTYGLCIMGCGNEAVYKKHTLCSSCYSSMRVWSNVKTPNERAARMVKLMLYGRRLEAVDSKLVSIGTSEHTWRRQNKPFFLRRRKT